MKQISKTTVLALLTFALLTPFSAHAKKVKCVAVVKGVEESISLRFDAKGTLHYWSDTKIAETQEGGVFSYLALSPDDEESGLEYLHIDQGPAGIQSIKVGTTADEMKISITHDLKRAIFMYRDLGSGNGNELIRLACAPKL